MDFIINEVVDPMDLKEYHQSVKQLDQDQARHFVGLDLVPNCLQKISAKFEQQYIEQAKRGVASEKAQFEYAWCLIRSKQEIDMKKGVALLEDLFKRIPDDSARRDYLFYMAIGYTKIKEYEDALKYTKAILRIEPTNHQALDLEQYIKKKMKNEGLMGMAIVGGAALAIGGLLGLGVALSKKS